MRKMKITNNPNELLISIPKGLIDMRDVQDFIDFIRFRMIVAKSEASEEEIEALSQEINQELEKANKVFMGSQP
jgi:hypothetical protein